MKIKNKGNDEKQKLLEKELDVHIWRLVATSWNKAHALWKKTYLLKIRRSSAQNSCYDEITECLDNLEHHQHIICNEIDEYDKRRKKFLKFESNPSIISTESATIDTKDFDGTDTDKNIWNIVDPTKTPPPLDLFDDFYSTLAHYSVNH
eukprot:CAMPEP_0184862182 /NCGR_PEP_ID=MMETSP0580-20130426/6683_1 /TAXON_ID=1118495 /ORGANISM="Dactyliosolen fragilissimus" /LENGTH=148 /DNA_ID=CAMNT_0027359929 /DNA_START=469 /DNA_END=915 /DNA_ORIENTATION=+